ncbi:uncharacterized protein LOC111057722 isoform X4 [Nilaparvata lugens]|uniref:uncharacterized protein LOC111057722 isoform X3 n=1 Tax=Nilaparvata lugens TaxID=108931 RepID=UPI00193E2400|nr:uncharacterized protein LOC111057722 isoform X3 [Nilaparvata lugens]XP_039291494.1 uncharacterized protein LOC111057722 isoform X4 [Nilaparvata lugens]
MLMMKSWQIALVVLMMLSIELKPADARRTPNNNKPPRAGSMARTGSVARTPRPAPYPTPNHGSSRAGPSQAGPSRAGPSQAGPSQAGLPTSGRSVASALGGQHYQPLRLLTTGIYQCMTGFILQYNLHNDRLLPEITQGKLDELKRRYPGNALLNAINPPLRTPLDLYDRYIINNKNNFEAGIDICKPAYDEWTQPELRRFCMYDDQLTNEVVAALAHRNPIRTEDVKSYLVQRFFNNN